MIHNQRILQAVAQLTQRSKKTVFTRDEVRQEAGISRDEWQSGYTAIFQGMRVDQPGAAPRVGEKYKGVFRRVSHGEYVLTEKGQELVRAGDVAVTYREAVVSRQSHDLQCHRMLQGSPATGGLHGTPDGLSVSGLGPGRRVRHHVHHRRIRRALSPGPGTAL